MPDMGWRVLRTEVVADMEARLEAAEGERDDARAMWRENGKEAEKAWTEVFRLREALEDIQLHAQMPAGETWKRAYDQIVNIARAALSTGDRQDDDFGGTGAVVLPESADGHETEGDSPTTARKSITRMRELTDDVGRLNQQIHGRDDRGVAIRTDRERRYGRALERVIGLTTEREADVQAIQDVANAALLEPPSVSGEGGEEG